MTSIIDHIDYDLWANLRLARASSRLSVEEFTQPVVSSFPSIQQTFVHILWAEELWLERWQGHSSIPLLDPGDYPTARSIQTALEALHGSQVQFLASLERGAEDRAVSYLDSGGQRWEYSLRQMVEHLVVHSAYHRGQLVTLLRQRGIEPPSTDYLVQVDSKRGRDS